MAYNNNGCNTCNPVIPPPCVEPPPICEGTECEEIYPGACVVYSGPDISCLGITNGMSLNDIIQIIGEQLCSESENGCINPVYWLLNYAKNVYDIHVEKGLNPNILDIVQTLINNGIYMPSCNICCPDWEYYIISTHSMVNRIRTAISSDGPQTNSGITNFDSCMELIEARDINILNALINSSGTEWGSIQGQTTLCLFNEIFDSNTFSGQTLYEILDSVIKFGLTIECRNGILRILNMTNFLEANNITLS